MNALLSALLAGFLLPVQTIQQQLSIVANDSLNVEQRRAAIESIAADREVDVRTLLPVYREIIEDPDADTTLRVAAVSGLLIPVTRDREAGNHLREVVPTFLDCLKSDQARLRENCALGLAGYVTPPLPAASFPALVSAAVDPFWRVRRYLLPALQLVEVPSEQGLDALLNALEVEVHPAVIQAGLASAGRQGVSSPRLLAFAVSRLEDRKSANREDAIGMLAALGPLANEALASLRRVVRDSSESDSIREAAERAILRIENP